MNLTILNAAQVRELLPMATCVELMTTALTDLVNGCAHQPLRTMMPLRHVDGSAKGILGVMPAECRGATRAHGLKAVHLMPGNRGTPHDAHQAVVLLFEPEFGRPVALLEGSSLTAIRTAAVSAAATRVLAPEAAEILGILGAGAQARSHIEAMRTIRGIRQIRIWNRTRAAAAALAAETRDRFGVETLVEDSPEAVVRRSEILCAVTGAAEPIVRGAWIPSGAHVNLVGSSSPQRREADGTAMAQPRLFTDALESLEAEAGDYVLAAAEGALPHDQERIEIGAVFAGRSSGRRDPDERTIFKALGLAVEDVAAGWHVFETARARGIGASIPFGES